MQIHKQYTVVPDSFSTIFLRPELIHAAYTVKEYEDGSITLEPLDIVDRTRSLALFNSMFRAMNTPRDVAR